MQIEEIGVIGQKYADHAAEEMGYRFIDRIIDLGGEAKVEAAPAQEIISDPVAFIKADLAVSVPMKASSSW